MTVVGTKVRPPSLHPRLVVRGRLLDRLGAREGAARLIVVSAPAGFGKSTLLAQWVAQSGHGREVAWLTLDRADAALHPFVTHLVTAIRRAVPDIGQDVLALLETGASVPATALAAGIVNDLDAYAGPLTLVLDDYQTIDDAEVHEFVAFLAEHLPPTMTFAIAGRNVPPLPLHRLRAHHSLLEIGATDLAFDHDEVRGLFEEGADDPNLVRTLVERTEGWPAAVRLALVALEDRLRSPTAVEPIEVVRRFGGGQRFVLDYLQAEVIDQLPADVLSFVTTTSILDLLTSGLCDAVTGNDDGQAMLERLERNDLFVVALDDERRWFRYHSVFADSLRRRLAAAGPQVERGLHSAALDWFSAHGFVAEARAHAVAAERFEDAADLVEAGLGGLRRRRETRTIDRWLSELPHDVIDRRPLLATYTAWRHLSRGDLAGVEPWLARAESALLLEEPTTKASSSTDGSEGQMVPAMISMYRAAFAQAHGDAEQTERHAAEALRRSGSEDHFTRGAASGFLGMSAWAQGDPGAGIDLFSGAIEHLRSDGMVVDALAAAVPLAEMWVSTGHLGEGRAILEVALAKVERLDPALPTGRDLHTALAGIACELGDLHGAAAHLEAGRPLDEVGAAPEGPHRWHMTMAIHAAASGRLDAALDHLDEAETRHRPGFIPDLRPIDAFRPRLWLRQARIAPAARWAAERYGAETSRPLAAAEFEALTLARVRIAQGDGRRAVRILDPVVNAARSAGRGATLIEAIVLRALSTRDDDLDRALDDLAASLQVGVPLGWRRVFLDEGPPVVELLTELRDRQRTGGEHAETLLAEGGVAGATSSPSATASSIREPLSPREVEVLRLLGSELSGPEIAGELYVSLNTLRTHTKHIFAKLSVNTRRSAVVRAAELGLL